MNTLAQEHDRGANGEPEAAAWEALSRIPDPEIPVLSLVDLGVIRFVRRLPQGGLRVGLSPTYSGCPATVVIRDTVQQVLEREGFGPVVIEEQLAPAWSSDWMSVEGRRKLREYGIEPPATSVTNPRHLLEGDRPAACPRCRSVETEKVSEFGSTPCKALYRCRSCREPFEYFKCI